jgi:adenosylhomocysteine nucleosidase
MRLGIISALHEEQQGLVEAMQGPQELVHGLRTYTAGKLWEIDAVCVLSRIGKVAAAMTATTLVERFGVTHILFTGVAGAGDPSVRVGDIVLAESLVQHDMDASPLFPRFEIPLTGRSHFDVDAALAETLGTAAQRCIERADALIGGAHRRDFGISTARVHRGLIVSGDRFVASAAHSDELRAALPAALAVEMEGAAIAQACADFGRPFAVLRTVSDRADDSAHVDFTRFIAEVASIYTRAIVEDWLQHGAAS